MADPGIGSGGGPQVRVWQGVGRRSRSGEGAGHPSRPARMAVFILYPFLSEGELQVLVKLSKVRYSTC